MPHIRIIFPASSKEVVCILENSKLLIRQALQKQFPNYPIEAIALIAEPISAKAMKLSDNLLPLEFIIDVGKQKQPLDDSHSDALRDKLIELCPELAKINFGLWLREMPSNGFTEHKERRLHIRVAFVHGDERRGKVSQLTIPASDLSVKDVRGYLIRCLDEEDGTKEDQKAIKELLKTCGIGKDSLENDPMEVSESLSGNFMEKDIPNWPVLDRMHFLFIHPKPLK